MPPVRRGLPHTHLAVFVGGTAIGWVTGWRADESYNQFPIKVLGNAFTEQHELVDITVSGSCEKFRIYAEPLVSLRTSDGKPLWYDQSGGPNNGGDPQSVTARLAALLENTELVLKSTLSQQAPALYTVVGWRPSGRSLSVSQGGVFMENFSWVAIKIIENPIGVNPY